MQWGYAQVMFNAIVMACSAGVVAVGYFYSEEHGLIIDVDKRGEKVYSSSLLSSGSNDAFIVRLGFVSFIVSATVALVALVRRRAVRTLKWIYAANVAFLVFVMWSVNLDVPVLRSIQLGDHLLLAGWIVAAFPLPFFRWAGSRG